MLPFKLSIPHEIQAGVAEKGSLPFWIENQSEDEMTAVEVCIDGSGIGVDSHPFHSNDYALEKGEGRWCPVHFTADRRGRVSVTVRIRALLRGIEVLAVTESPLTILVKERGHGGKLMLNFGKSAEVSQIEADGDIEITAKEILAYNVSTAGTLKIDVQDDGVIKKLDARAPEPVALTTVGAKPLAGTLQPVPLKLALPAWATKPRLDLAVFYAAWQQQDPVQLVQVWFVDGHCGQRDGSAQATPGAEDEVQPANEFKLKVCLRSPGHLMLISQGESGRHFILWPNQAAKSDAATGLVIDTDLFWPGELHTIAPDQNGKQQRVGFTRAGTEHVLAVLTQAPLLDKVPQDPFQPYDPNSPSSLVRKVLLKAWSAGQTSVALATVHVT